MNSGSSFTRRSCLGFAASGFFAAIAKPATPTQAAASVISLFSTAYTNAAVDTWLTNWSPTFPSGLTDPYPIPGVTPTYNHDGTVAVKPLSQHPEAASHRGALSTGQLWTLDDEQSWVVEGAG